MSEDHFEAGSKNCEKAIADCGVMTEQQESDDESEEIGEIGVMMKFGGRK